MCDNDFVMCDVPKESIEMVVMAWRDFKSNPSDRDVFVAFDWIMNVALAKWQSYADTRKASGA